MNNLLKGINIFANLDDNELEKISLLLNKHSFLNETVLFNEGDEGNSLYIIEEGSVDILKRVVLDETNIVARLEKGNFFGEMSLFDNQPRSASAKVNSNTILYSIEKDDLERFLSENLEIAYKIHKNVIAEFCKRLRTTNENIQDKVMWGFTIKDSM